MDVDLEHGQGYFPGAAITVPQRAQVLCFSLEKKRSKTGGKSFSMLRS